jgi:hypothetical protein
MINLSKILITYFLFSINLSEAGSFGSGKPVGLENDPKVNNLSSKRVVPRIIITAEIVDNNNSSNRVTGLCVDSGELSFIGKQKKGKGVFKLELEKLESIEVLKSSRTSSDKVSGTNNVLSYEDDGNLYLDILVKELNNSTKKNYQALPTLIFSGNTEDSDIAGAWSLRDLKKIIINHPVEYINSSKKRKKEKNRIEDFIDRRDKQEDKQEDKEESADDGDTFFSRILGMGKSSQKDVSEKVVKSKKRKIEIAKKSNEWNVFGFGKRNKSEDKPFFKDMRFSDLSAEVESYDCDVCQESFLESKDKSLGDNILLTPCQHYVHKTCLGKWFDRA